MNTCFLPNPVLPGDFKQLELDIAMAPARERGKRSESMFELALIEIQRRPELLGAQLTGFEHAEPNSYLDRHQIDFIVSLQIDGAKQDVLFNVKSGEAARSKFERKMRRMGRLILAVAIHAKDDINRVVHKVVKSIRLGINILRRKLNEERHRIRLAADKNKRKLRYINLQPAMVGH